MVCAGLIVLIAGCGRDAGGSEVIRGPFIPSVDRSRAEVWAVGDGADGSSESIAVARMIDRSDPDRLLYLGDVYPTGTASDFEDRYEPSYGRLAEITAPTLGNHEDDNVTQGYEPYWRGVHGKTPPSYYAFRIAGWRILSLNSQVDFSPDSAQLAWLRKKVKGPGNCSIAFWHVPRFNAGTEHGENSSIKSLWDGLRGSAKLILNGHDHSMQRQSAVEGMTQMISGAGGDNQYPIDPDYPGLRFGYNSGPGALRMRLEPGSLSFAFVDDAGRPLDRGKLRCRTKPRPNRG